MRIGFFGPVPPYRGGIAQHSAQLITALRARGHRVDVHSWAAQYPGLLYPGEQQDATGTPFPDAEFRMRWWNPLGWWQAGRRARHCDALIVTWVVSPHALPYRVIQAGAGGRPVLAVAHKPLPYRPRVWDRFLARRFLPRLHGALSHAGSVTEQLGTLAPGVAVATVPHPPNLAIRQDPLPAGPPWRLLFLGHLRPYKGLDIALGAMRHLLDAGADVRLQVAGNPWKSPDEWRAQAEALGVAGHVDFRFDYVPDEEMADLLATHHLLVAPYTHAVQSGVIPLALAAGRPTVATDVGGLPEAVRHGVDGIITPPNDPAAFAQGVLDALADLDRLAEAAAQTAVSWDDVAAAMERLVP